MSLCSCPLRCLVSGLVLLFGLASASAQAPATEQLVASLREPLPAESDPIAEQLIETYFKAIGGKARFLAVRTLKAELAIAQGPNTFEATVYWRAPDEILVETRKELPEDKVDRVFRGYDGKEAWLYDLTKKHPFPVATGVDQLDEWREMINLHGILADWQERGCRVEYMGPVKSRGLKNYLVKLYLPNGMTQFYYFDAKSYLLTRVGSREVAFGTVLDRDAYLARYASVEGLWLPVRTEFEMADEYVGSVEVTRYGLNPPLEAAFFAMPQVKEVWLRGKNAQ